MRLLEHSAGRATSVTARSADARAPAHGRSSEPRLAPDAVPLVTIGIPTFNRAGHLRRAVASCRAQTYQRLEIVISDNASSDETAALCDTWARLDGRIRVIRQTRNLGREPNFAAVLNAASGTLFMWLSDDDWLDPDYVETCAKRLIADPGCALAGGIALYHTPAGPPEPDTAISLRHPDPARRVAAYFATVTRNGQHYGIMRRADVHLAEYPITLSGDWYFVAQIAALGTMMQMPEVNVHRSAGGDSTDMSDLAAGYDVAEHWGRDIHLWALRLVVPSLARGRGSFGLMPPSRRLAGAGRVARVLLWRWWSYAGRARVRQLARAVRALLERNRAYRP